MAKRAASKPTAPGSRYVQIMRRLFEKKGAAKVDEFEWARDDLSAIASELGVKVPSNIGDNIYAIRHGREELPEAVRALAGKKHWLLLPHGRGKYKFVKARHFVVEYDKFKQPIKVPDATPQIVAQHDRSDEQAVLARLRYNRLIDIFLGVSASALQSHLRITVEFFKRSQIETDELYVAIDRFGAQYVVPVQAKGRRDQIGAVQIIQDVYCCREKFPNLICRSIAAKTIDVQKSPSGDIYTIALMEVFIRPGSQFDVAKGREEHYVLVPAHMIKPEELSQYRRLSEGAAAIS